MSYTPADFETMTGKELDQVKAQFEQADIAPAGWGKMRVSDKQSWLKHNLDKFRKAIAPAELSVHAREKKARDARKKAQKALTHHYGSYATKQRVAQYLAGQNPAADPDPMTRQARRLHVRRTEKSALYQAKMEASKSKRKGGAAAVLSAELV